jgi:hypothetical protein
VELPAEGKLERVVNAALNGFFQDIYRRISEHSHPMSVLVSMPYSPCPSRRLF